MSSNNSQNPQNSNISNSANPNITNTVIKKKKIKKTCLLCKKGCLKINYTDTELLKNYLKKYNKILTHKISGNCLKHQHQIANSIKRARYIGLLPFVCN